ncbi:hypothetical protein HYSC106933_11450 [Hydrogenibacillus schlegelii]
MPGQNVDRRRQQRLQRRKDRLGIGLRFRRRAHRRLCPVRRKGLFVERRFCHRPFIPLSDAPRILGVSRKHQQPGGDHRPFPADGINPSHEPPAGLEKGAGGAVPAGEGRLRRRGRLFREDDGLKRPAGERFRVETEAHPEAPPRPAHDRPFAHLLEQKKAPLRRLEGGKKRIDRLPPLVRSGRLLLGSAVPHSLQNDERPHRQGSE